MSDNDLLSLYGAIRTSVDTLRELATGIDDDIGRRQIYGEPDAVRRALDRTRDLAATIAMLENQLFTCARSAPGTVEQARAREAA